MSWVRYAAKAIYAGVATFIGALLAALEGLPSDAGIGDVSLAGWLIITGATLAAVGGVFGITNGDKP